MEWFIKLLPDLLELIRFLVTINDKEFESITTTWPAPIKTRLARVRFESRLMDEFPDGGNHATDK